MESCSNIFDVIELVLSFVILILVTANIVYYRKKVKEFSDKIPKSN